MYANAASLVGRVSAGTMTNSASGCGPHAIRCQHIAHALPLLCQQSHMAAALKLQVLLADAT